MAGEITEPEDSIGTVVTGVAQEDAARRAAEAGGESQRVGAGCALVGLDKGASSKGGRDRIWVGFLEGGKVMLVLSVERLGASMRAVSCGNLGTGRDLVYQPDHSPMAQTDRRERCRVRSKDGVLTVGVVGQSLQVTLDPSADVDLHFQVMHRRLLMK